MSTLHDDSIPRAVQELNQLPVSLIPPPPYEEQPDDQPAVTMHKLGSSSHTKISTVESNDFEDVVVTSVASTNAIIITTATSPTALPTSPPSSKPSSATAAGYRRKKMSDKNNAIAVIPKIPVPSPAGGGGGSSGGSKLSPRLVPKPRSTPTSARTRIGAAASAKETPAGKKPSNSGIPLRLKIATPQTKGGPTSPTSSPVTTPAAKTGGGTYTKQHITSNLPIINKNTLEVQFLNNKKRLMQLHGELLEKQRPLIEMHKCLLRTKKQLEEMGKKVALEPLKMVTLKEDDVQQHSMAGCGEAPINEATHNLKSSVETMIGSFAAMCKKCLDKQDNAVKMLESVSKAEMEVGDVSQGVEILKQEKSDLESILDRTVSENEKKIAELVYSWQQVIKNTSLGEEAVNKISELEDRVKHQQKLIADGEENVHHLTRRFDEKKLHMERSIAELSDKIGKLEEDVKKEKKTAAEHVMKTRSLKNKVTEAESRARESEEKYNDVAAKLRQAQDQLRKKEVQWVKEKDDFKKNEALLQQKFTEKQYHIDARLKSAEDEKQSCESQYVAQIKRLENELEAKEKDIEGLEKDRALLTDNVKQLGGELENMRDQILSLNEKIDELQTVKQQQPVVEQQKPQFKDIYQANTWLEVSENKRKISDAQKTIQEQMQQIIKMQNSLKAHAQLAVALKQEKDNAVKYSNKLRDILQEAKDEIESKNRAIYKIHEKLVLREADCDKLRAEIKDIVIGNEYPTRDRNYPRVRSRCLLSDKMDDTNASYVHHVGEPRGESSKYCPSPPLPIQSKHVVHSQQEIISESLLGMSVKKVDNIRARLDNLKKMRFPVAVAGKKRRSNYSWIQTRHSQVRVSSATTTAAASVTPVHSRASLCPHLLKQIELRGKLYHILQRHADRSCEDLLDLLKKSVSVGGGGPGRSGVSIFVDELKPSRSHVRQGRGSSAVLRSESDSCTQLYPSFDEHTGDLHEETTLLE